MAPSPRPPPPPWIGLGPPVAGALLLAFRGLALPASLPAWLLLGGAVGVVAILELVSSMTQSRAARQPELMPLSRAGVGMTRLAAVAVASLDSMIAVAVGLGEPEAVPLMLGAGLLMVLMAVIIGVRRISGALAAVRAAGHGALVKGYGPFAYSNKEDPRIWVPKLSSVGHTLNFAHAASWLILSAFLVLPLAAVALALAGVIQRR